VGVTAYAFVAVTTRDLPRAHAFWTGALGFPVTEEAAGYFIVDAGGLRLCVDLEDGSTHQAGGTDPVIGLLVDDVGATLASLEGHGISPVEGPKQGGGGAWAAIEDPDGRRIILTESP